MEIDKGICRNLRPFLPLTIQQATIVAFDPDLRKIPGPWLSRLTNIPLKLRVLAGKRDTYIDDLHRKYG